MITKEELIALSKDIIIENNYQLEDFAEENFVITTYTSEYNRNGKILHIKEHPTVKEALDFEYQEYLNDKGIMRVTFYLDYKIGKYYFTCITMSAEIEDRKISDKTTLNGDTFGALYMDKGSSMVSLLEPTDFYKLVNIEKLRSTI